MKYVGVGLQKDLFVLCVVVPSAGHPKVVRRARFHGQDTAAIRVFFKESRQASSKLKRQIQGLYDLWQSAAEVVTFIEELVGWDKLAEASAGPPTVPAIGGPCEQSQQ